jgi:gamma-glutamyltranspeptidase
MLHNVRSYRGMTTSPHHLASEAGLSVLRDGGDALEAAVAIAANLAAVYPHMTSIGGDSFWLVTEPDGGTWCIDACGAAAQAADLDLYRRADLNAVPWRGPLAANTVAGAVSGWGKLLERAGGAVTLERILRDAIWHAENGVAVTRGGAELMAAKDAELKDVAGFAAVFRREGRAMKEGERLKQPALAQTLRTISKSGCRDFYDGTLGRSIAADLARAGSPVGATDLAAHRAKIRTPLSVRIKNAQLFNMTAPTQGFASLMILALFDRLGVCEAEGFAHVHGLVEATKSAFSRHRAINLGDPRFMSADAQAVLDDSAALDSMAARIDMAKASLWPRMTEFGDTTWFAAADANGRVVSAIQSTYFEFGSGIVLPETGVVWQNRGASFTIAEDGWNCLKPGRKPFHTLNPALARFDDGRIMAYGTMGGEGQPQTQAAIFSRYFMFGQDLQAAITAPRWLLGRTWGEDSTSLKLESRFDPALVCALRDAGHPVEILPDFTSTMGHAGAIVRHLDGLLEGANDPRSDGAAAGW